MIAASRLYSGLSPNAPPLAPKGEPREGISSSAAVKSAGGGPDWNLEGDLGVGRDGRWGFEIGA